MATQDMDFWRRMEAAGPGLFDLGVGLYGQSAGRREAGQKLAAAQGPLYQQAMAGSQAALSRAGSMDPQALAQERFNAQRGLLTGSDAADETALMRMLRARGMLGAANYNPGVPGINPTGVEMNPQLAAFYAARGGRDARMAADSLDYGDRSLDNMINRAGMLQRQAASAQGTGLEAQRTQPSRALGTSQLLRGVGGVLKDTGLARDIFRGGAGLLGRGADWLGQTTGLWGDPLRNLDLSGFDFGDIPF